MDSLLMTMNDLMTVIETGFNVALLGVLVAGATITTILFSDSETNNNE